MKNKIVEILLDLMFAAGLCAITAGAFTIDRAAGWITAGVCLIVGSILAYKEVYHDAS